MIWNSYRGGAELTFKVLFFRKDIDWYFHCSQFQFQSSLPPSLVHIHIPCLPYNAMPKSQKFTSSYERILYFHIVRVRTALFCVQLRSAGGDNLRGWIESCRITYISRAGPIYMVCFYKGLAPSQLNIVFAALSVIAICLQQQKKGQRK